MDRGARKQRFHQIGEKGHSPRRAQPGFRTLVPVSSRADSTIARASATRAGCLLTRAEAREHGREVFGADIEMFADAPP